MRIQELFASDVTRDIPPVVYFHEQSPAKLADEVREYIVTGGYDEGTPQSKRVPHGIHEEFRKLIGSVRGALATAGGPSLPASWISGFYGSGKSSFAKLIGLGLDKRALPDGRLLADAFGERDDSPNGNALREEWRALRAQIDSMSVVFDIGGAARNNEHIHNTALRKARERLEYASNSVVAEFEHKLEQDGLWERFLAAAKQSGSGRDWSEQRRDNLVDQHFSHAMHVLDSVRYPDPLSWVDAHSGQLGTAGTSVEESVRMLDEMLQRRAPGKVLFFVIDEVSQYIHQDEGRMLALQSWVSELGQRMKGRAWVLATGQQKLEEQGQSTVLSKLKDRFPPALRVHLDPANIRDVVHKRLLKKSSTGAIALRNLFSEHRADMKLHALGCEALTEEDFVEIYPMLPSHIDLLLRITSELRNKSSRAQSDAHAIRGLLQLLGELFRRQKLAEREVGQLVSFDLVYEVLYSALSPDMQSTLTRIIAHPQVQAEDFTVRVAKVLALLEQIQSEKEPTSTAQIAQCLYRVMGEGSLERRVAEALDLLQRLNFVSHTEKLGFKIQSSAGQAWQKDRDDYIVGRDAVLDIARKKVGELFGSFERPKLRGQPFSYIVYANDSRQVTETTVVDNRSGTCVTVDVRLAFSQSDREPERWYAFTSREDKRDRVVWVTGDTGELESVIDEMAKSSHMVERHRPTRSQLPQEKQHLLLEEEHRLEGLERRAAMELAKALMSGEAYFRGRDMRPRERGQGFSTALTAMANEVLPELYHHFVPIAITEVEFNQLLEPTLMGPSQKFFDAPGSLGILSQDQGRTVVACVGEVPKRVLKYVEDNNGVNAGRMIAHFERPPFGHSADMLRAVLLGLLRAGRIKIRPEEGPMIASIRDAGARDVFKDRALKRADILCNDAQNLTARDLVALARFFRERLDLDNVPREREPIADAVFDLFPARRKALAEFEARLRRLPRRPEIPALRALDEALAECLRSRQVEETVLSLKARLDVLRDGLEQLAKYNAELTEDAIDVLVRAQSAVDGPLSQLCADSTAIAAKQRMSEDEDGGPLLAQLESELPWRDAHSIAPHIDRVWQRYLGARRTLVAAQVVAIEEALARVQSRPGFERLDEDRRHRVLRPLKNAAFGSATRELEPSLAAMEQLFATRLLRAEDDANNELDTALVQETKSEVVVSKVDPRLRGREIATEAELTAVLDELRARVQSELAQGRRVRFG
jgi:hypothetical protein